MKSGLQTLIKLQKTQVDEQRTHLAKLDQQLQAVDIKIALLEAEKQAQESLLHENPDMGLTYAGYLAQYLKKRAVYARERHIMVKAIEMARDKLAELFEEQKRYEIAEEQRLLKERQKEAAEERKILDEVGSVGFIRKQG